MKKANWLARLIAATASGDYRLNISVSTLINDVRSMFSTSSGQASWMSGMRE